MTQIVAAYLNRPTRDRRTITSIDVSDPPWPILSGGVLVGHVDVVDIVEFSTATSPYRVRVLLATPVFDGGWPDPDWDLWCLTVDLKDVELHSVGADYKMSGKLAAFSLDPAEGWPWEPTEHARSAD